MPSQNFSLSGPNIKKSYTLLTWWESSDVNSRTLEGVDRVVAEELNKEFIFCVRLQITHKFSESGAKINWHFWQCNVASRVFDPV